MTATPHSLSFPPGACVGAPSSDFAYDPLDLRTLSTFRGRGPGLPRCLVVVQVGIFTVVLVADADYAAGAQFCARIAA